MQTEDTVKANGGSVISTDNLYPFDAPEVQVEIALGKGVVLTHVIAKPSLQNHLSRERAVRRISRVGSNQEITTDNNESDANSEFYNELILRATARKGGDTLKEYDQEQCREFTYEQKDRALVKMYSSWFEVEEDDDPLSILFEREGTMTVRQEIGEEARPSYILRYTLKNPSMSQRQDYNANNFQIKRKVEKRKTTLETVLNLNKGVKLFSQLFEGVEGGRIQAGEFSAERKAEFLSQIDPMFMNGCVDAAVAYFDKSLD